MRIFISGGIAGVPGYKEHFEEAEKRLKRLNEEIEIINPAKLPDVMPESTTHEEYMKICFYLIDISDGIYQIAGWEKSPGACQEYGYALGKGKMMMGGYEE